MTMIPTFYHGDTIRVELSLYDESGVAHVVGVFAHTKPGRFSHRDPASRYEDIWLHGEGQGKIKAEVAITGRVDERTATGGVCVPLRPSPRHAGQLHDVPAQTGDPL